MKKSTPVLIAVLGYCSVTVMAGAKEDIPLPVEKPAYEWSKFALGVTYVHQSQDYRLTGVDFTLPPNAPPLDESFVNGIENSADSLVLKFSYTPLPFITLFAVGGYVDGSVDVSLAPPVGDVAVDYDGWIYGGGLTLAYAHDHYFATVTGSYTYASVDDAEIDTLVVAPRIGIFNEQGALWIGANYQRTEHTQAGSINLVLPGPTLLPVNFSVDLEDEDNWNFVVGGRWNFTEDLSLTAEVGFAEREEYLISIEKKF